MSVKRESQIPSLARAPRTDVVGAVAAGADQNVPAPAQEAAIPADQTVPQEPPAAPAPTPAAARRKKRAVTFTNRLDPELLDWMAGYKDEADTTIAAILDEALRDYIEKTTGTRPQP